MILNQCLIIDGHKQGSIVNILPKTEQIVLPSEDSEIINGHYKVDYYKVHNFMIDGNYFLVTAKDEFTLSNNEIKKMILDSKMLSTSERIMEKPELREFNNSDIGFNVANKEYERLMLIYSRNNAKEITQTCSPVHVQSVIEDMQNVIVRLILELTKESK